MRLPLKLGAVSRSKPNAHALVVPRAGGAAAVARREVVLKGMRVRTVTKVVHEPSEPEAEHVVIVYEVWPQRADALGKTPARCHAERVLAARVRGTGEDPAAASELTNAVESPELFTARHQADETRVLRGAVHAVMDAGDLRRPLCFDARVCVHVCMCVCVCVSLPRTILRHARHFFSLFDSRLSFRWWGSELQSRAPNIRAPAFGRPSACVGLISKG